MSGLAINGDTVHGLAVGGNAFVPENDDILSYLGKDIDVPSSASLDTYQISPSPRNEQKDAVIPTDKKWSNGRTTIYAVTITPPEPNPDLFAHRDETTRFVGVMWKQASSTNDYFTRKGNNGTIPSPILIWLKLEDIIPYIVSDTNN